MHLLKQVSSYITSICWESNLLGRQIESESEAFVQAPFRKRTRMISPALTESEAEISSPPRLNINSMSRGPALQAPETESEASDPDTARGILKPIDPLTDPRRPRPAFKPSADQQLKGPLILGLDSEGRELSVPRCVAMYLRPYQEEGVRFFWERYKEGRGGILGNFPVLSVHLPAGSTVILSL